ncbi:AhpC/TSA family protein [Nodosilinea sp. LEGE 07088]|uniref:peroxiredoxin-like family protein n=1 Tax=Nodosilinea sp. LEGE 07088 TaxID=2777968 RepID=UPI00187F6E31|nr:AhpC/TSA family protein [Nodosilinea sp. LEGE 07088]
MDSYEIFLQTRRQRVSDGVEASLLGGCDGASQILVLVWPQLGDFDSLESAWWLQRAADTLAQRHIAVRAVGIGDRASGQQFCVYSGFPADCLFVDETAELHRELGLYAGLTLDFPGLKPGQTAWLNLMLMCAGMASPGTLREVLRGYTGDRSAPQLIGDNETVQAGPLPPLTGKTFRWAGGSGFQRPFELATLRLRNMTEVLSHWSTYVPNAAYLTQRGGTFLLDADGELLYEYRDRGILGFAANMANPLDFLDHQAPMANAA